MPNLSRFPIIVGPPNPEDKAAELTKAVGKTVASVEFGREKPSPGRHESEALILFFTDGSSMAIVVGTNAEEHAGKTLTTADDRKVGLDILWKVS